MAESTRILHLWITESKYKKCQLICQREGKNMIRIEWEDAKIKPEEVKPDPIENWYYFSTYDNNVYERLDYQTNKIFYLLNIPTAIADDTARKGPFTPNALWRLQRQRNFHPSLMIPYLFDLPRDPNGLPDKFVWQGCCFKCVLSKNLSELTTYDNTQPYRYSRSVNPLSNAAIRTSTGNFYTESKVIQQLHRQHREYTILYLKNEIPSKINALLVHYEPNWVLSHSGTFSSGTGTTLDRFAWFGISPNPSQRL